MKRYKALIRKLIEAAADADSTGQDIAEVLRYRCFNETGLVRQTLMNAVCDPRFKIGASYVGSWREDARRGLQQLADTLEATDPLTEEKAYYTLDDFLGRWFRERLGRLHPTTGTDQKEKNPLAQTLLEFETSLKAIDDSDEKEKTIGDSDEKEAALENCTGDDSNKEGTEIHEASPQEQIVLLEDMFLSKIPLSLITLVRKIGRVGEYGHRQHGRFMRAGKSDIAGITIGNDITAVLPTELALLAEKKTQDLFYHRFAAHRLQLFASASQSDHEKRHQDGPVIICTDTSNSMAGRPMMIAKVIAIAVSIIAWRRKRDVIIVKYSDSYDCLDLGHSRSRLPDLLTFMRTVTSGGNNENEMFDWLFGDILPGLPAYKTADLLCISDFGWTTLSDDTIQTIKAQKERGMRFYGLNIESETSSIMSPAPHDGLAPMQVCDAVWTYQHGECKEVKTS